MTSYLQIENLTKSYGDRILFDSVTFGVNQGDKIGLIAKNGSGKTTLLNIIAGKEAPDSGSVIFRNDLRVGIVDQTPELDESLPVIEACLSSDTPSSRAIAAYEEALASGDPERAMHLLESAEERNSSWNLLRARVWMETGSFREAAACLHRAEQAFPEETAPLLETCYRELEDYKRAYEYACKQK